MASRLTFLICLLFVNVCSSEAGDRAREQVTMTNQSTVRFGADIEIDDQDLVLRYRVVNEDHRDLYLLNRLYRTTPEWDMSPDVIYIHLNSDERSIWLNKKLADIPSNVLVNTPVAPFVTPVRAGQEFEETVRIPLPVRDYRQYGSQTGGPSPQALRSEPVNVTYEKVFFTLGYYWKLDGTREEIRQVHGKDVVVPIAPRGGVFPEFGELKSEVWNIAVPVLEYREPVESP